MFKKKLSFLILSLFTLTVVLYPLGVSAQTQYARNTGNQCTYCHNSGYSLNLNGQAYRSAGYPAVNGWKNTISPVKPTVPKTKNTTNKNNKSKVKKHSYKKHHGKNHKKSSIKGHHKSIKNHYDNDDDNDDNDYEDD